MLIEFHVLDYDTTGPVGMTPLWVNPAHVSAVTNRAKYERDKGKSGCLLYLSGDADAIYIAESVEEVVAKLQGGG